ncbi:MAG TPA: transcriptional repressor [Syntrophorhabdaceae bacterium]|jgi:Fur family peroxide stress response transcriptional regulator
MAGEKKKHFKMTPQRMAILKYLENNKDHPSALDIYTFVSKTFPTMSLATVYNTLKALKDLRDIRELFIDSDKSRFDPDTADHNHLICIRCRRIVDIQEGFGLSIPENERQGFEIIGNHVDFYGTCPSCNKGERADKAS